MAYNVFFPGSNEIVRSFRDERHDLIDERRAFVFLGDNEQRTSGNERIDRSNQPAREVREKAAINNGFILIARRARERV